MITYINKKTNNRYPEHGCESSFSTWSDGKTEYFIKGQGWKKFKEKDWIKEEIPDLSKPFTTEQFKEYSNKYGMSCAQEFLDCCDYMKPRAAWQMFNPPMNQNIWENPENEQWFKATFNDDLFRFMDGIAMGICNTYSLDIIQFEKHLAYEFKYPMNSDNLSMKDFMIQQFGQENTDKFQKLFLKNSV